MIAWKKWTKGRKIKPKNNNIKQRIMNIITIISNLKNKTIYQQPRIKLFLKITVLNCYLKNIDS